MKPRLWYRFENSADPAVAELHIVDFIGDWIDNYFGFGVTAKAVIAELAGLPSVVQTIRVHVNSPGGDVWSAINIANALRDQRVTNRRTVETVVDGLAASAASVIIMAGDPIRIADNGLVMIHRPMTGMWGTSEDLLNAAAALDKVQEQIVATYRWHSELSADELVALMKATTWMTADEAIANGFATEKAAGLHAAAALTPEAYATLGTIPERFRAAVEALVITPAAKPAPAAPAAIARACREAGFPELTEDLLGKPLDQVEAALGERKTAKAAGEARATEIRQLCAMAKVPELAEDFVAGGLAVPQVKSALTRLRPRLASAEIDNRQGLDGETGQSWTKAIAKVQGTRTKGA